jgi:hypothetical protein
MEFLATAPAALSEAIESNEQMRMKFPTETNKFYQSEESMNEILTSF